MRAMSATSTEVVLCAEPVPQASGTQAASVSQTPRMRSDGYAPTFMRLIPQP